MEQLNTAIIDQRKAERDAQQAVIKKERKIKSAKDTVQWLERYHQYHAICSKVKTIKSQKKRETYRWEHEAEFIFYDAAVRHLKECGIAFPPPAVDTFEDQIAKLEDAKDGLRDTW